MTRGGNHGGGRPQKPLAERAEWKGKIAIRISVEAAAQLQRLMLRQIDGVGTPEQMIEYLIAQALAHASPGCPRRAMNAADAAEEYDDDK